MIGNVVANSEAHVKSTTPWASYRVVDIAIIKRGSTTKSVTISYSDRVPLMFAMLAPGPTVIGYVARTLQVDYDIDRKWDPFSP